MPNIKQGCADTPVLMAEYKFIIGHQCDYCVRIVGIRCGLAYLFATSFTFMGDNKFFARFFDGNRWHHTAAQCGAVAGIIIDMP